MVLCYINFNSEWRNIAYTRDEDVSDWSSKWKLYCLKLFESIPKYTAEALKKYVTNIYFQLYTYCIENIVYHIYFLPLQLTIERILLIFNIVRLRIFLRNQQTNIRLLGLDVSFIIYNIQ